MNGNIAADAENLTDSGAFMNFLTDKTLADAQVNQPQVTHRAESVFKL
jgi:hypothetical protein